MGRPWLVCVIGITTVFFGIKAVLVVPSLLRLIQALRNLIVNWPGPKIYDYDTDLRSTKQSRELSMVYLFPLFVRYSIGAFALTLILSILFYTSFLQMDLHWYSKAGYLLFLTILNFTWGIANSKRTFYLVAQINSVLTNSPDAKGPSQNNSFSTLTYPKTYDQETLLHPGKRRILKLISSIIPDFPYVTQLILLYQWNEGISEDDAKKLAHRAISFVSCSIYDAAEHMGLKCKPSPIPNGRRSAWFFEYEKSPISLTLSTIDMSERTCQMTIGPMITVLGDTPGDITCWEKLHTGCMTKFSEIKV